MTDQTNFPEVLRFRPRWWWDPVPDYLLRLLDKEAVIEIAKIQLEFQQVVLAKQLELTERVGRVIAETR
jgi:hypothetical protein